MSLKIYHAVIHGVLLSCPVAGAPSCLEMLDKLQRRMYRTVGPLLAVSLEHLTHRPNVVEKS